MNIRSQTSLLKNYNLFSFISYLLSHKTLVFLTLLSCSFFLTACTPPSTSLETETTPPPTEIDQTKTKEAKPIKIIKFFDFQCQYCRQSANTMEKLEQNFGDQVTIEYRHFPAKVGSKRIAEAAECARDQGLFAEFSDRYFNRHLGQTKSRELKRIALDIGVNPADFDPCLDSGVKKSTIEKDLRLGQKYGVQAVPFFVIDDVTLTGSYPYTTFEKLIQKKMLE